MIWEKKKRRDEIPKRFVEMCSGLYMKLYTKNPTKASQISVF